VTTILMLGAGGSAASNVLDALRLSNPDLDVVGADCSPIHLHLSRADTRVVVPRAGEDGYLGALSATVMKYGVELIHAQPDPDVRVLGAIRGRVPARTFLPSQEALDVAGEKASFNAAMHSAGVPAPETISFANSEELRSGVASLVSRFGRAWVRARVGAGSRGALPVRSAGQAIAWVEWWAAERGLGAGDFVASEYLPGREFAYESVWQNGRLVAAQARERLEYFYGHVTPSGQTSSAAVARTVRDERVDLLGQDAVLALDASPQGVYHVDMKEAIDGTLKVTEINAGRFPTTCNFFAHAGLNLPALYLRCALGEELSSGESSPLPPDLYWIRMVDMGYRLVPADELDAWPRPCP